MFSLTHLKFAREHKFTDEQISAFFTLLHIMLENVKGMERGEFVCTSLYWGTLHSLDSCTIVLVLFTRQIFVQLFVVCSMEIWEA